MMRAWMAALASAMLLLSAGCALREQKPAGAWLEQRQAWFLAHPEWSVQGRLGLSDGQRGGSLSMRWRAVGEHHVVDLSAGLGGKRWRLEMTPSGATLTGTDLAPLHGPDPDVLVERAVGWPIPVTWMSHWLRGLPAPERARLEFAADGTLERLAWAGWRLRPPPIPAPSSPPRRPPPELEPPPKLMSLPFDPLPFSSSTLGSES